MSTPASGPTRTQLDGLWARYQNGWRRLLSLKLLYELDLRVRFDLDLLAPEEIANQIPVGRVPDCARCDDICCAGVDNVVSLRLRDIAELMDLGRTDLISRQKPRFPAWMLKEKPALDELSQSWLWRTLPVLKQNGERRICAALTPELRCGLHPHWPLSCERFPYSLRAARRDVVWGTRCPSWIEDPDHQARSEALFRGSIDTFNERVRDAVLLTHARRALDRLGIGAFLTQADQDPFERPPPRRLPVLPSD